MDCKSIELVMQKDCYCIVNAMLLRCKRTAFAVLLGSLSGLKGMEYNRRVVLLSSKKDSRWKERA